MATHNRTTNLMKPWAWLAAVAAVCLVLASSTALFVLNSGVRLGLPWWTAVAAPLLVYALVLPLCIPRIRFGGWLVGFVTLIALHAVLGFATAWLYAHVGFTSFREAMAPAFWRFPPALVLEMVGSLLMTLPFMGALAPRPAARPAPEAPPLKDVAVRKPQSVAAAIEKSGHQAWARPAKAAEPLVAPAVATIVSAVPPPPVATVAPVIEERPVAAPAPLTVHAAPLSGTNGAPPEIVDDAPDAVPDFRQALSELFDAPAAASTTRVEEAPAPPAQIEAAARTAPEVVTPAAPGAAVRIPFDRVVGQLPPGAFRVPLLQVGARLREPETLLVAQALILPQLGEGVVEVAWEAVAEQFPAAVFAVPPAEVKERIVNGRLLLPLDEIVKQLPPDVFGAFMVRGPVAVPGIEGFPAPFKPLGREEPAPSPAASVAGPVAEQVPLSPAPLSIDVPSEAELAADLQWTPPSGYARFDPPTETIEPASDAAALVDARDASATVEIDRVFETVATPAAAETPSVVESIPEVVAEPIPVEPLIRIPFDRVAAQFPPGAFRVALPEVGARLREADTLVVTQALVLPQLAEGAVHVAWDDVVGQFPMDIFAVGTAAVRDLIEGGWLLLPLDEIVRQLPPDVFGAAMSRGPVHVPGIEGFPAPFKPLGYEEPVPAVAAEAPLPEQVAAPTPVEAVMAAPPPLPVVAEPAVEVASPPVVPEPVFEVASPPVVVEPVDEVPAPPPVAVEPAPEIAPPSAAVAEPVPELLPSPPAAVEPVAEPPVAPLPFGHAEAAIEVAMPEPAAAPQPVPVAPLYEAQAYERPVPFEPPAPAAPAQPEKSDRAERIAALVAPLEAGATDEARVGDFTIIGVSTAGLQGIAVTAPAGRLGPVIARAVSPLIDQVTLRGAGGSLVLTPVGSGWRSGTILAVGARSGGALARLEMLAAHAAAGQEVDPPQASARGASPFARLDPTASSPALAAAADDLTMFGPLEFTSYREPASGAVVHCLVSPAVSAAEMAPFAWELAQVMAQSAPAEALGAFHSAVLRSGSTRIEIRRLPSAAGPARILVVGGSDRGRPGLARLQIERTAARLTRA